MLHKIRLFVGCLILWFAMPALAEAIRREIEGNSPSSKEGTPS